MFMLDIDNMSRRRAVPPARKKPVQISIDTSLLEKIDAEQETRAVGRSAFIANAVLRYLRDKENEQIDEQFRTTLTGEAVRLYSEVEPFLAAQVWPDEDRSSRPRASVSARKRASGGRR